MFERVTGELRAKLGVDSAAMCARAGHEACGAKARSGRVSRHSTEPPISDQAPPVWRAPEGAAAVPVGGGGAWPGFETTRRATQHTSSAAGVEGAGGSCRGAGGRWRGLAGLRVDAPSEARGADGSRAGRRPPAHTATGPSGAPNTSGATSNATEQATLSRNYSPARRSTSCMMRPHTALTHATAATPRTRERQGLTCRKSSKP